MCCNRILRAVTNRMPPKCFNCCCWDINDRQLDIGYCWLLERNTNVDDKPEDCPLIVLAENENLGIFRFVGKGKIVPNTEMWIDDKIETKSEGEDK